MLFPVQILDHILCDINLLINYRLMWQYIRLWRFWKKISNAYEPANFKIQLVRRWPESSLVWCNLRLIHQMFDTRILFYYIKISNVVDCFIRKLTVFIWWLIIMVFTVVFSYGYSVLRLKDAKMCLCIDTKSIATGIRFSSQIDHLMIFMIIHFKWNKNIGF